MSADRLGQRVSAPDRLERHIDHNLAHPNGRSRGDRKTWMRVGERWGGAFAPQPVEGILVGIRSVQTSGWRRWLGEDGIIWEPEGERRRMALVVERIDRNPVRVWLDDLEVVS